jgi:MtN3 and saliva related transmembrane protein
MAQTIGFTAGMLTALAFLPQVLKSWRTRSTGDLSIGMLLAQGVGVALWIFYGVAIGSGPVIMSNTVTLTLTVILLGCKVAFGAPRHSRGAEPPSEWGWDPHEP